MQILKLQDDSSLSRKEKERFFKRREILLSACKIFSEKGFEASTLDEIAEASEYGKGTLYNYFQNKEDIYVALLEAILIEYLSVLKAISDSSNNFIEFMYNITEELFRNSVENETTFLLLIRMRAIPSDNQLFIKNEKITILLSEVNSIYKKFVDEAINAGQIREINIDSLLVLYRNMTFSYIYHLKFCKKITEIDIKKESEFLLNIFFNGIIK